MKPRIKVYCPGGMYICESGSDREYQCAFGYSMRDAFEKWFHATQRTAKKPDEVNFDDIPF